jgi:hypothetical protein
MVTSRRNHRRGGRPSVTSLVALFAVACAPWVSSGCGSSNSTSSGSDAGDGSTGEGGEGGSSSGGASSGSSSGSQGDDTGAGDGSSSGVGPADGASDGGDATVSGSSGASSGSCGSQDGSTDGDATVSGSSGGDAGDGGDATVGSSSGSCGGGPSDAGADGDASPEGSSADGGSEAGDAGFSCGPYTVPLCGVTDAGADLPCDLHDNFCCLTFALVGRCLPKDGGGGTCTSDEVNVGCAQACECGGGQVCCAVQDGLSYSTGCQPVAPGGHCQPYPQTCTTASAQLCVSGSECVGNEGCIPQTCVFGANLNICGIQSESPFNCAQRDAALE